MGGLRDPVARAAYRAAQYAAHREESLAANRAYYAANREREQARSLAYAASHRKERRANNKIYRSENTEKILAKARAYRDSHPERMTKWRAANLERNRANGRAAMSGRRARERGAPGVASAAQIAARWQMWGGKCWICSAIATTTDHVKPISRGGSNWPANLRPACLLCNSRKHAKWPYVVAA